MTQWKDPDDNIRYYHEHVNHGSPFNFTSSIECPACIEILWNKRHALCDKYGWERWPDALNQGRDYLPSVAIG